MFLHSGKSTASPLHVEAEVTLKGGSFGANPCLMEVWTSIDHYLWLNIGNKRNHEERTSIIASRWRVRVCE